VNASLIFLIIIFPQGLSVLVKLILRWNNIVLIIVCTFMSLPLRMRFVSSAFLYTLPSSFCFLPSFNCIPFLLTNFALRLVVRSFPLRLILVLQIPCCTFA